MQINTVNLGWVSKTVYGADTDTHRKNVAYHLINDGCANIATGAWMLATRINESGHLWRGVGRYHSPGNVNLSTKYAWRVYGNYVRLAKRYGAMKLSGK
jgi:hypothetical protein